jgi:hypothetical protein
MTFRKKCFWTIMLIVLADCPFGGPNCVNMAVLRKQNEAMAQTAQTSVSTETQALKVQKDVL